MSTACFAQFSPPGGMAPYIFNAPESAGATIGASTANSANTEQNCRQETNGRGGSQYECPYQQPTSGRK